MADVGVGNPELESAQLENCCLLQAKFLLLGLIILMTGIL